MSNHDGAANRISRRAGFPNLDKGIAEMLFIADDFPAGRHAPDYRCLVAHRRASRQY